MRKMHETIIHRSATPAVIIFVTIITMESGQKLLPYRTEAECEKAVKEWVLYAPQPCVKWQKKWLDWYKAHPERPPKIEKAVKE